MPTYFRFGVGPFRFSQRLGRTAAQKRAAARAAEARRNAAVVRREARRIEEINCEVIGFRGDKVVLRDRAFLAVELEVPRSRAGDLNYGQHVKVRHRQGKLKSIVPESEEEHARCVQRARELAEFAQRRAEQERQILEQAKKTGHLLLGDGEVDAWHGVTPDGKQCHHRHRSPEAASECAAKRAL